MEIIPTDCLVIGAGLAGSAYALRAASRGRTVELLSLAVPLAANARYVIEPETIEGKLEITEGTPPRLRQEALSARHVGPCAPH